MALDRFPRRIAVAGTSASGKSTLGRRLSELSGIPYIELDALHWLPNWTPSPAEEFREKVRAALDRDAWIVDGNYGSVRNITWANAEHLIWLDYALPRILWRLTRRTLQRTLKKEVLWGTNREELRMHFLSKESLYLWVLQSHPRHRRTYPELLTQPGFQHLTVARVRNPRDLERHVGELERLLPAIVHSGGTPK